MAVVKIIELVGSSKTSTDDAAKQALSQATELAAQHPRRRHRLDRYPGREPGRVPRPCARCVPDRGHRGRLRAIPSPPLSMAGERIDTEGTEHGGELPPERLAEMLEADEVELIDVRRPHEWEAGRIPGARRVEVNDLPAEAAKLDPSGRWCSTAARDRVPSWPPTGSARGASTPTRLRAGLPPGRRRGARSSLRAAMSPNRARQPPSSRPDAEILEFLSGLVLFGPTTPETGVFANH